MNSIGLANQFSEPGIDRPGNDYKNFDIPPPQPGTLGSDGPDICELNCNRDQTCKAWTYVNAGVQGPRPRCWLKTVIPSAVRNGCCTSGVSSAYSLTDVDRPGSDYKSFDIQAAASGCADACQRDSACAAWTYVKPGIQAASARCWLKNKIPDANNNNCCTSGIPAPRLH
ncbi:PAN domain-containing protein [Methylobacterium tardum]|uniref:PAN domain-containing protein n=1 Tax=Methylobacterium tardum TaxID=374432 RepID=UPI001EDCD5D6|nr:PAN domain-containing protein [Methylobacterium tardum]URD39909.1 PAN domain-containing protein [Methylobacterium tardum]